MTSWMNIFEQSPVNGCDYTEPTEYKWTWPDQTWFQRRLSDQRRQSKEESKNGCYRSNTSED